MPPPGQASRSSASPRNRRVASRGVSPVPTSVYSFGGYEAHTAAFKLAQAYAVCRSSSSGLPGPAE